MHFSLFIEIQVSPVSPAAERQAFHQCVEQVVLAEELGYHGVWAVEHHGLLEYSHCSAPEVLLGFIAASRPESVELAGRLGSGSLNFTAGTDEQLVRKVELYRGALPGAAAPGRRMTNQFCCTPAALILDDDLKACELGFRGARFFQ